MSSLPPALDFAKAEEAICDKWAEERTFKTQDRLGKERGDEVRPLHLFVVLLSKQCGRRMSMHEMLDAGCSRSQQTVDWAVFLYPRIVAMHFWHANV